MQPHGPRRHWRVASEKCSPYDLIALFIAFAMSPIAYAISGARGVAGQGQQPRQKHAHSITAVRACRAYTGTKARPRD